MHFFKILTACALLAAAPSAHAAVALLDFEGLNGGPGVSESVGDFYNGGRGERGSGPGPNFGITFSVLPGGIRPVAPFAICSTTPCNAVAGNSLFIFGATGNDQLNPGAVLHVANGFRGVVEFDAQLSGNRGMTVFARRDTGGNFTGVHIDAEGCARLQCAFRHYSFNLADDVFSPDDVVGHDIVFRTDTVDALFVDNIRFSDLLTPQGGGGNPGGGGEDGAVPEPGAWALMIAGFGMAGGMLRRRRTVAA